MERYKELGQENQAQLDNFAERVIKAANQGKTHLLAGLFKKTASFNAVSEHLKADLTAALEKMDQLRNQEVTAAIEEELNLFKQRTGEIS